MESLNLCLSRDDLSRPWGFRLQGGFETGFPLSVQRVFSGSPAEGVLQRGDVIKSLDNAEAHNLNSKEIQDIIRTSSRELSCIVERENHIEQYQEIGKDTEPRVSVKAARKKFLTNENIVPKPFGDFGTSYAKKNDSVPTNVRLDMTNDDIFDKSRNCRDQMEDVDDKVDYSFSKMSVSERKKLFATPDDSSTSIAMPRQRCYSVRPSERLNERVSKELSTSKDVWNNCNEQRINTRNFVSRQFAEKSFSPKCPIKMETMYTNNESNFPSSVTSSHDYNSNRQSYFHPPTTGNKHETNAYIFRCGNSRNGDTMSTRPSEDRPLVVKTYQIRSNSTSQSPIMSRPACSTLFQERSGTGNWSNMSVRSEPVTVNLGFDHSESIRFNPNPVVLNRNTNLGLINLRESNQVLFNSVIPNLCLNNPTWNDHNFKRPDQTTHHYIVKSNPVAMNTPTIRREISVPRSHSNLIINPIKQTQDDSYSRSARIKYRECGDDGSEF